MKKKILFTTLLLLATSLSLSGCSFLEDFMNNMGGGEQQSGENNGGNKETDKPEDKTIIDVTGMDIVNEKRHYEVGDKFIKPTVIVTLRDESTLDVTDKADCTGYDMTVASEQTVEVSFKYYTSQTSFSTRSIRYNIHVRERNDVHVDPDEDLDIKTLEIQEVTRDYLTGDNFDKPKVYAVHFDNTKEDVSSSEALRFEGYDENTLGVQEITVIYGSHTLTYDIYMDAKNPDENYPVFQNNTWISTYNKTIVIDETYTFTYTHMRISDGEKEVYGGNVLFKDTQFFVEDPSIASIDKKGNLIGLKAGKTYVHVTYPYGINGVDYLADFRCELNVEEKELQNIYVESYKNTYYSGKPINFAGRVYAEYQTGYREEIIPTVDTTGINVNNPGEYTINLSYSINGVTKTTPVEIEILDASLYTVEIVEVPFDIDDLAHSYGAATALPHHGTLKSLVIPVKFTDSSNFIPGSVYYSNIKEDLNKAFFGTNEETGWRSVKTYYEEESFGEITYTGVVSDWFNANHPTTYYYGKNHLDELANAAVDWFFENNPSENRQSYDVDGDGLIDGLNLIYGCPDDSRYDYGDSEGGTYWAYVRGYSDSLADVSNPVARKFLFVSYDTIYPTKAIAAARGGNEDYRSDYTDQEYMSINARTLIHETGHMFGIDDYYSYTNKSQYYAGHANMQTVNMCGHDPYSVMLFDWAEPYIPESDANIQIGDFQTTHDFILLTPQWNMDNSPFDEYFLLDLFVPSSGLNEFDMVKRQPKYGDDEWTEEDFNTIGVRIWHVDARLITVSEPHQIMTDPTIKPCTKVTDNSIGDDFEDGHYLKEYDKYAELQLVRNDINYKFEDAGYTHGSQLFQAGDSFSMDMFSKQFVNGNKMDNGKTLGWTVTINGIYNSASGYIADIQLTR